MNEIVSDYLAYRRAHRKKSLRAKNYIDFEQFKAEWQNEADQEVDDQIRHIKDMKDSGRYV